MKTQTTGSTRKKTEIGERLCAALKNLGFREPALSIFMNRCSVADINAKPTTLCRVVRTDVLFRRVVEIGSETRKQEGPKTETDLMVGARVIGAALGRTIAVTKEGDLLVGYNQERTKRMARIQKARDRRQRKREALEASRVQSGVAA